MPIPAVLRDLLTSPGPSGVETTAAGVFRTAAEEWATEVTNDQHGNSFARVAGTVDGSPSLAIVGHVDEIGVMVQHIDDDGYLWFAGVGGWDPIILVGQRIELITRNGAVSGVVGKKPIHLMKDEDRKSVPKLKDLHIDIGAADGDEARGLVRIGDVGVIAGEPVELPNERVISRAMDNRLGTFVAFEAARLVAGAGGAPGDVVAVATVQEEVGLYGARTAGYSLNPGVAIAVDVTFATDQPGVDTKELGKHVLGSGAVIGRGTTLHPIVSEMLHDTAEAEDIPFTVMGSQGRTGTDADVLQLTRAGIPTGIVSIPLRYMHSPVEMVQLSDVHACARLIAAFAQRLSASTSFAR